MFDLEYLKDENDYNKLIDDVEVNFPKYKKAIQSYFVFSANFKKYQCSMILPLQIPV